MKATPMEIYKIRRKKLQHHSTLACITILLRYLCSYRCCFRFR
ncbi:hypothetical protein ES332_A02G124400v1 [Gossypium tomentosum]|uniref:Uncharacterized protein n=1 Tax=Gossypium tomentosum TaxID=34277 RepID=A0A5D2RH58_GOSTO|nr:hypothetical protein ES332_A02G124400v1 [Gossypium tomentosum]